jgi:hypothetical protein
MMILGIFGCFTKAVADFPNHLPFKRLRDEISQVEYSQRCGDDERHPIFEDNIILWTDHCRVEGIRKNL